MNSDILTPQQAAFIEANHMAAMITVGADGAAKAVRIVYTVVDGDMWSSGMHSRLRTRRLRKDPRCTLFVFDPVFSFLSLETTVDILDGPDAPDLTLRYRRLLDNNPDGPMDYFGRTGMSDDEFRQAMVEAGRLIYRFTITKATGTLRD
jgi:hypothetical protein